MTENLLHTALVFGVFFIMFLLRDYLPCISRKSFVPSGQSISASFWVNISYSPPQSSPAWCGYTRNWLAVPHAFHSVWHETPYGVQLMTAIFLSDMCIYWAIDCLIRFRFYGVSIECITPRLI